MAARCPKCPPGKCVHEAAPAKPTAKVTPIRAGGGDRATVEELKTKLTELVTKKPGKAATILGDWVNKASAPRRKAG